MIPSYPSLFALGHRSIADIFQSPVVIEEKVDGSQWSMAKLDGVLACRSKGKEIVMDAPEKMFLKAVETARRLDLRDGWTYRGEFLGSPNHNTLKYDRVPVGNIIIFDIMTGPETYLTPTEKKAECERIGLECVPCLYDGTQLAGEWSPERNISKAWAETLLQTDSILGGCKVEGFVVKNYNVFTQEKKIAIAKYVSEAFKEKHQMAWKASNPGAGDYVESLIVSLKTDARWNKAIQHLREAGTINGVPQDIGVLLKEVQSDTLKEEGDAIREALFNHFWPKIQRGIINGFPEYYKRSIGCGEAALN